MTLWQFGACVDGYRAAHETEGKPEAPSKDEFYEMVGRLS
jgi:hypothetical protein